jgi:hypothetical protein
MVLRIASTRGAQNTRVVPNRRAIFFVAIIRICAGPPEAFRTRWPTKKSRIMHARQLLTKLAAQSDMLWRVTHVGI